MSETQAAQLSKLFASAGWTRSTQNFEPRPFVQWHGSFYSVAGSPPGMGSHSKACRTEAEVIAFLASIVAAEQAIPEPEPEPAPDPRDEQIAALQARIAELEAAQVQPLGYPDEAPEEPAPEPYVPDFTLIPEPLARFAEADETADDFRARLKSLWQRFGIEEGQNFPGGGEPLTGEEKILMREIDIVLNSEEGLNASLLQWLNAGQT